MSSGFSFRLGKGKGSKRKLKRNFGSDEPEEPSKGEEIKSFGNSAVLKHAPKKEEELVIPLLENPWVEEKLRKEKEKGVVPLTEDELAAKELINELGGGGAEDDMDYVIPLALTEGEEKRQLEESVQVGVENTADGPVVKKHGGYLGKTARKDVPAPKRAPMLMKNRLPENDSLKTEKEKLMYDVSLRPDELDVHEPQYGAVPIEKFGEAMLRGMGWKKGGKIAHKPPVAPYEPTPRPHRLPLQAKTLSAAISEEAKKRGISNLEELDPSLVERGALRRHYADGRKRILKPSDLLREKERTRKSQRAVSKFRPGSLVRCGPGRHGGRLAVVMQTEGVSGLDKMQVLLLRDGLVSVRMKDAMAVKEEDLLDEEEREVFEKLKVAAKAEKAMQRTWLRRDLRVKIVDSKGSYKRYHCHKGRVRSVTAKGVATVRISGLEESVEVPEKHLETVVPDPERERCRVHVLILRGSHSGRRAEVLKRGESKAELRLKDGSGVSVSLDDCCEVAKR